MPKRPLSVTVIAWLFIVAGTVGLVYHATEFKTDGPFQYELVLVCLIRLLAIVCGAFMLRGSNGPGGDSSSGSRIMWFLALFTRCLS